MKITETFLVQQQIAQEEHLNFLNKLMETGKVELQIPPDCFIWTGTKEELESFLCVN